MRKHPLLTRHAKIWVTLEAGSSHYVIYEPDSVSIVTQFYACAPLDEGKQDENRDHDTAHPTHHTKNWVTVESESCRSICNKPDSVSTVTQFFVWASQDLGAHWSF